MRPDFVDFTNNIYNTVEFQFFVQTWAICQFGHKLKFSWVQACFNCRFKTHPSAWICTWL